MFRRLNIEITQQGVAGEPPGFSLDIIEGSYGDNIRSITRKPTLKELRVILDREIDAYFNQYQ